jgi:hypothetical protein
MSVLDRMQQHPGEWFPIGLDELASLASNADQVATYLVAQQQRFRILASWQGGKMYCKFVWPDGREKFFETTMSGRQARTVKLCLPVE